VISRKPPSGLITICPVSVRARPLRDVQEAASHAGAVGNCAAGGFYTDKTGKQAFVVNQT